MAVNRKSSFQLMLCLLPLPSCANFKYEPPLPCQEWKSCSIASNKYNMALLGLTEKCIDLIEWQLNVPFGISHEVHLRFNLPHWRDIIRSNVKQRFSCNKLSQCLVWKTAPAVGVSAFSTGTRTFLLPGILLNKRGSQGA
eukprot:scaffold48_cov394-Pavlova_lutheri.AAC.11